MTGQNYVYPDNTSERGKRLLDSSSDCSSSSFVPKRRVGQERTVEDWISQCDREFDTSVWLKYIAANRKHVAALRCSVCSQFRTQLESMRNFRPAFIDGTTNEQQSSNIGEYSAIARSMSQVPMDASTTDRTKRKFEIAYMLAKEKLAMASICELEERHGVIWGRGIKMTKRVLLL